MNMLYVIYNVPNERTHIRTYVRTYVLTSLSDKANGVPKQLQYCICILKIVFRLFDIL